MSMRSDFQTALLFKPELTGAKSGTFRKGSDGKYLDERIETMYQGYKLGRERDAGQLARYNPERYLAIGLMNQINRNSNAGFVVTEDVVRTVLKAVGGTPV